MHPKDIFNHESNYYKIILLFSQPKQSWTGLLCVTMAHRIHPIILLGLIKREPEELFW